MTEAHYRKLETMYHFAPHNKFYNPIITISHARADLKIPVQDKFHHTAGAVHGAVYFKALDDTAFFAVNSLVEDVFVLTVSFNIYLTHPISSGEMKASGEVVFSSNNLFIAESILVDSEGRELSRGSGSFVKSRIKLTPEIGYK
jgi:uncharacterized protein (TIGR00369 family)